MTDIEYLLTVSSSTNSQTMITKLTHHHLDFYPSDQYIVSVVSQRCSGNLKSNTSNTLLLFLGTIMLSLVLNFSLNFNLLDGPSSSTPESQGIICILCVWVI